jgi:hypothetical protein
MPAKYKGYAPLDANRLKNNVTLAFCEADKASSAWIILL